MIESGIVVSMGLLMMLYNLPWRWKLRIVSNIVLMDIGVFIALMFLHTGTHAGVMTATAGALFTSLTLATARKCIGQIVNRQYVPGIWDVRSKL